MEPEMKYVANMHGNEVSCAKDLSAFEILYKYKFSFPQKITWRRKLFIFKYQTWIIKVQTLFLVKLQAQLAGSWEGAAAAPGRAPLHLLLGRRQGQSYLSILVHHGIIWACKSTSPSYEHLLLGRRQGQPYLIFVRFGTPLHYLGL